MPWFKVDDSFYAHPKVFATDADALGLWVVAGAWSSAHLTDGFVPDHVLARLLPDSDKLARKLAIAGLWRKARGGYRFHDWGDFNPKKEEVEDERKAARERMRKLREQRRSGYFDQRSDNEAATSDQRSDIEQDLKEGRGSRGKGTSDDIEPDGSRDGSDEH